MSLNMSHIEREAFLADVHVGVIGIEQPGHPPLAVPVWYDYAPQVGVRVVTGRDSLKARLLQDAGRFALCAQVEQAPLYRYVSVEGPIVSVRTATLEGDRRPLARRYFGKELGDRYAESTDAEPNLVFTMRPERWRTLDYAKLAPAAGG